LCKFVVEATAALPFGVADEPLFLVHHLARLFTLGAATSLSGLKEHFQDDKPHDEKTLPVKELQPLPGYLYALRLKHFLKQFYALSAQRCAEFDPGDLKQLPLNARADITRVDWDAAFPLDLPIDDRSNWLQDSAACNALYLLFKKSAKEDEEDLPLSSSTAASSSVTPRGRGRGRGRSRGSSTTATATLKRKRDSTSLSSGDGPSSKKARMETKKKSKKSKSKKRGSRWRTAGDEGDGPSSDEDYDD